MKITAYFCDSAALGLWFSAPGAAVVEASHPSGASFRATFGATGVSGEITLGGQSHAFVAQPASFPAGLWEGFVDPAVTPVTVNARYGWVVLPDGSQRGSKVVNTAVSGAGQVNTGTGTGEDGTPAAPSNPPPTRPVRNDKSTEDFCTDMFRILRGIADLYNASSDDKAKGVYLTRYTVGVGLYDRAGCQAITGVV